MLSLWSTLILYQVSEYFERFVLINVVGSFIFQLNRLDQTTEYWQQTMITLPLSMTVLTFLGLPRLSLSGSSQEKSFQIRILLMKDSSKI